MTSDPPANLADFLANLSTLDPSMIETKAILLDRMINQLEKHLIAMPSEPSVKVPFGAHYLYIEDDPRCLAVLVAKGPRGPHSVGQKLLHCGYNMKLEALKAVPTLVEACVKASTEVAFFGA